MDGIWVLDNQGRILKVNEAFCKLSGYSCEELLSMSVRDLEAMETAQEIQLRMASVRRQRVARFKTAHRRKDGVIFPVEISTNYFEIDNEEFFLVFIRDLSEQNILDRNTAFNNELLKLLTIKAGYQEFLDAIVKHIHEWCGCTGVGLALMENSEGFLKLASSAGACDCFKRCVAMAGQEPDQIPCLRFLQSQPEPYEAPSLTLGGAWYCHNLLQFIEGLPEYQKMRCQIPDCEGDLVSVAVVPLRHHEKLQGAIFLAGGAESQLPFPAVEFLESMAPLVSEGIARHTIEAELELNLLKQGVINGLLSLALEDLPLDELLQHSLELLTDIPWIGLESKGAIFLVENHSETLVLRAQKGLPEPVIRGCAQIPFGRCFCGQPVASRRPQFSGACDATHEFRYEGMAPHGHYCLPILFGERVLGVMNLYVQAGHRHSVSKEEFLKTVAHTLAGFIMRQEAEEARRRSDHEFMLLVGNVPAIVCKGYAEGYASFMDNKVEAMLGYPREDFDERRLKWTDLILKEDMGQASRIFIRALKGNRSYVREYRMRCKSGEVIWVQERSQIVLDPKGKVDYISGVLFDISKRKQGEEAVRQEKETAQRYLDVAPVIFTVIEASGKVTLINKKGCEILGYPEGEIIGKNWFDHFIPEKIREGMKVMFNRLMSGEISSLEYYENPVLTKTGEERIIAWYNTILKDENGTIIGGLSSGEDITERRRAEEALKDSVTRLSRTLEGTVTALATAVETRDPYTAGHQRGVAQLAQAIAAEMGFSQNELEGMRVMGFLHDIGKIAIPAEILSKPGKLTEYEFNIVKFHSQVSYDILKEVDFPWPVALAVLQHHEKMDGSGYPHGLQGEDIIMPARILTVADVVEAMASHRPYRPALGIDRAIEEVVKKRGILYDHKVVDACLKVLREKRVEL